MSTARRHRLPQVPGRMETVLAIDMLRMCILETRRTRGCLGVSRRGLHSRVPTFHGEEVCHAYPGD